MESLFIIEGYFAEWQCGEGFAGVMLFDTAGDSVNDKKFSLV